MLCVISKIGVFGCDWWVFLINVFNCLVVIVNDGMFEVFIMLLVMFVSEVMAVGIVNWLGFMSVLNVVDGFESDCVVSLMIWFFFLFNLVVFKLKIIMVGNSDEFRDIVGVFVFGAFFFVFVVVIVGVCFDLFVILFMFDEIIDVVFVCLIIGVVFGGDYVRGVCGDFVGGVVLLCWIILGSVVDIFCSNCCCWLMFKFLYIVEFCIMCVSIGDVCDCFNFRSDVVRKFWKLLNVFFFVFVYLLFILYVSFVCNWFCVIICVCVVVVSLLLFVCCLFFFCLIF